MVAILVIRIDMNSTISSVDMAINGPQRIVPLPRKLPSFQI
jgi:hypothetical protein